MQNEMHCAADTFRSEAQRCWKNATAMYCRASTGRDADTRRLYVEIAVCWAALAVETEKRLALAYKDQPPLDFAMARYRWRNAATTSPALTATAPRPGS